MFAIADVGRRVQTREAAQQVAQALRARFRRVVRRKQSEHAFADGVVSLVDDSVAPTFDQHLRIDEAGQRDQLPPSLSA